MRNKLTEWRENFKSSKRSSTVFSTARQTPSNESQSPISPGNEPQNLMQTTPPARSEHKTSRFDPRNNHSASFDEISLKAAQSAVALSAKRSAASSSNGNLAKPLPKTRYGSYSVELPGEDVSRIRNARGPATPRTTDLIQHHPTSQDPSQSWYHDSPENHTTTGTPSLTPEPSEYINSHADPASRLNMEIPITPNPGLSMKEEVSIKTTPDEIENSGVLPPLDTKLEDDQDIIHPEILVPGKGPRQAANQPSFGAENGQGHGARPPVDNPEASIAGEASPLAESPPHHHGVRSFPLVSIDDRTLTSYSIGGRPTTNGMHDELHKYHEESAGVRSASEDLPTARVYHGSHNLYEVQNHEAHKQSVQRPQVHKEPQNSYGAPADEGLSFEAAQNTAVYEERQNMQQPMTDDRLTSEAPQSTHLYNRRQNSYETHTGERLTSEAPQDPQGYSGRQNYDENSAHHGFTSGGTQNSPMYGVSPNAQGGLTHVMNISEGASTSHKYNERLNAHEPPALERATLDDVQSSRLDTDETNSDISEHMSSQYHVSGRSIGTNLGRRPGMIPSLDAGPLASTKTFSRKLIRRHETPEPTPMSMATYDKGVERKAKEVLKAFGVPKKVGLDWFDTLLAWFPEELTQSRHNEHTLNKILADVEQKNKSLHKKLENLEREHSNVKSKHQGEIQRVKDHWSHALNSARHEVDQKTRLLVQTQSDLSSVKAVSQSQARKYEDLSRAYTKLEKNLEACQVENQNLNRAKKEELDRHDDEITQLVQKHEGERAQFEDILLRQKDEHEKQLQTLNNGAQAHIAAQAKQFNATIRSQKQIIASHSKENNRPTPDDVFQLAFQTLCQDVGNLISYVHRPNMDALDTETEALLFDTSGYLARRGRLTHGGGGRAWPRFCRSLCWQVLAQGFFQGQPGYGVLGGGGEGHGVLCGLQELFASTRTGDATTTESGSVNDKDANGWRAGLFEALLDAVKNPQPGSEHKKLVRLFHANIERVANELVDTLQRVSGARLEPGGPTQVEAATRALGMLALEMATQRAHLLLEMAPAGARIKCGSEERFRDEGADGDTRRAVTVELTTQPCLRKLGDGRDDMTSVNILVVGQIVALDAA